MKLNRPPRTWSASNAAAAARPNHDSQGEPGETAYELGPLGDALGAYVSSNPEPTETHEAALMDRVAFLPETPPAPTPIRSQIHAVSALPEAEANISAPVAIDNAAHANVVAISATQPLKEPIMAAANPSPFLGVNETPTVAPISIPVAAPASTSVETLVSRLNRTRSSIADALAYCGDAADEINATAGTFAAAAAQMRAVAAEHAELEALIAGAVNDLLALNQTIDMRQASAVEDAATLLAETAKEAEQLRTVAVADVERARQRLLQFTTEIGNVASELQGGIGHERQTGHRIA